MAKQQSISVDVFDDGTSRIEPDGFDGDACLKETEDLEEALGKVTNRKRKNNIGTTVGIGDKTKVGSSG